MSWPQSRSSTQTIKSLFVIPLRSSPQTPAEAIAFIEAFDQSRPDAPFTRYEVGVRYSNGDEIRGQFSDKTTAIAFLPGVR
jgi:hypothetical protein